MPAWALRPYTVMLPRLEADETSRRIEALLFAGGHAMEERERPKFMRRLQEKAQGGQRRRALRKITPGFARRLGVRLVPPPGEEARESE